MAKIKRVGVLKFSGFMGLYGAFIGIIFGIVFFLISIMFSSFNLIPGFLSGFWVIILLPIFYGITGFIGGLIFTPIMNLTLKIIKGVDLNLETDGEEYPATKTQPKYSPTSQQSRQVS